ncbi:MAG: ornithine carbamoyltransferase [Pseudomonadota bacterium]
MRVKHFLDLADITEADLRAMLAEGRRRKAARAGAPKGAADADAPLKDHLLALIFEKNSTRTRFSFDVAMRQLGGGSIVVSASDMQLGRGETIADTARVLSRYVDAMMLRTGPHEKLVELAGHASVPVLNGLTDFSHPCQILADLMTVEERFGDLQPRRALWCGDGNNVAVSWIQACALLGWELTLACPEGYRGDLGPVLAWAEARGRAPTLSSDLSAAATGAEIVIADTFVSMGQDDAEARLADLAPFAVTADVMARAAPNALFLHCLPAHRGEEVSAEVIDGPQSAVWDEAENRVHAQKAALLWCFGKIAL